MATLNIENAKRFSDLTNITTAPNGALLLLHDGNGVKTISAENLKKELQALIDANTSKLADVAGQGAGAHNAIYRGKNLGTSVTASQYSAISSGTFDDLYIGDYWTINGINYAIAAFDYYYRTGDGSHDCTTHHAVMIPLTSMYTANMNDTDTTAGGYVNSKMYTTNLNQAKTTINTAFSGHVMTKREFLVNATTDGYSSGMSWYDSTVDLMTESNVYGTIAHANLINGTNFTWHHTLNNSQYPIFRYRPDYIHNRQTYWLRDVSTAPGFCSVYGDGYSSCHRASYVFGVRPAFCIF